MKTNDKILLIEDDRIDVLVIQKGVRRMNVPNSLIVYNSAVEALDFLKNSDSDDLPKVIILDLELPTMDGMDFLKIIKKDTALRKIPVVVVTTSQSSKNKIACYDLQVAGYFVKPLDYMSLIESIVNYWTKSEFAQAS